jgi:cobalt/nickel transport system permease protein
VSLLPTGAFVALLGAWIATIVVALAARIGAFRAARAAFFAAPFLLAALPLVFTRPEQPLGSFTVGPVTLTASGEGLRLFGTIALKSWISVQAALLLAFTTPFHELVDGLRALRLPRIMVAIISFMYRYLAVLSDEATHMLRARAARSGARDGRGGGSLRWRAAVTGRMAGSLFIRSYERSERIYAAMQARGFEGMLRHVHGRPIRAAEIATLALFVTALVGYVSAAHLWLPRQ